MTQQAQKLITLPGVTFRIFCFRDDATGEDEIFIMVSEQGYYELEKQAQQRGKTVEENIYPLMIDQFRAHGFNIPPDCFFVTVEALEDGFTDRPSIIKPTYN